jgi:outer membrane protein assembly factor BamB
MRNVQRATLSIALTVATVFGVTAAVAASVHPVVRAVVPAADWTTYHHDALRTGDGSITGTFKSLKARLNWHLPTSSPSQKNDQIYGSPLVVGDTAFVTTLENRVYAISTVTGRTIWERGLGERYTQPGGVCGDIKPNTGIVSTPVVDEGRGELFVVAAVGTGPGGTNPVHRLFGLSLATGRLLFDRGVDPPGQQVIYLLQRPGLAIASGRVIIGFGGNGGDCGTYHGWVVSVPETGSGPIDRYEVASKPGQGRGAVWMGGGAPTIDKAGNIYVADGNGNATSSSDAYDFSDAVLKLTPSMHLIDWFAPTTWYSDNLGDLDLGTGVPQLLPDGLLLQVGKTQTGYVLNPSHLGHIDASVRTFTICSGLGDGVGGDALVGSLVVVPCDGGLDAVRVSATSPYGTTAWTQTAVTGSGTGPPVYGAGTVWAIAGSDSGSTLYGLNPNNGTIRLQFAYGATQNHFPTPAIGDNMVLVASNTQLLGFGPN